MEVDATGAGGATTTTTTANDRDDDPHLIDAVARAASSAPSESLRLAACSELAARCAPLDPRRVLDRVTFDLDWWDHKERSEDVRLERCRLLSAALLVLTLAEKGKTDDIQRKASAPPSSSSPPLPLPAADLLSGRVARCLALSLRDGFHEVALAACAGAQLFAGLLAAEASRLFLSARDRALALDSVAVSSSSSSSSPSLPLPADLLVDALARVAASHRRHAEREAAAGPPSPSPPLLSLSD